MDLEKAEELNTKLPITFGSQKKQENSRKKKKTTSISASLTKLKPLTVRIKTNWKILKDTGMANHSICLLRNLYAAQEATARTRHGKTDWFKIGKGVHQDCILPPCLFNFYAEYIMKNARLNEIEIGIKIAGRNQ